MILINGSILDYKPTGLGIYTYNILKEFNKHQLKYSLFTSIKISEKNIKKISLPYLIQPNPYKKWGGILRFLLNQTYYTYLSNKYNISYLPTPHGSIFSKNQIVTIHDLLAMHFPSQHKLQYFYYKFFMPIILKNAKKIIAISESTKSDLIRFYDLKEENIKVIHNGFDKNFFQFKPNAKEYIIKKYKIQKFIFTVGSNYSHKNIDKLIEAFCLLNNKDLKLVITGQIGKNQKTLIEKFQNENVIFTGYVDFNDLPYFYSAAIAMIYPSLYEGFGFPPLEAMSCKCPVIVSNTSSLPEVCGEAAYYINPSYVQSIKKGIEIVINDNDYREKLIEKGLEQIIKFDWESTANQILKLFEEIKYD